MLQKKKAKKKNTVPWKHVRMQTYSIATTLPETGKKSPWKHAVSLYNSILGLYIVASLLLNDLLLCTDTRCGPGVCVVGRPQ